MGSVLRFIKKIAKNGNQTSWYRQQTAKYGLNNLFVAYIPLYSNSRHTLSYQRI